MKNLIVVLLLIFLGCDNINKRGIVADKYIVPQHTEKMFIGKAWRTVNVPEKHFLKLKMGNGTTTVRRVSSKEYDDIKIGEIKE